MKSLAARAGTGLLVVLMAVLLDFNYRSGFLLKLGALHLVQNLAVLLTFLLPVGALLGLLLWSLERLRPSQGELAQGAAFLLIAYLSALHLKLVFDPVFPEGKARWLAGGLALLMLVAYPRGIRPNFAPDSFGWLARVSLFVWPVALVISLVSWLPHRHPDQTGFQRPHVVIVTSDSLSAEAMAGRTPQVDAWAEKATVFEQMLANANGTSVAMPCFLGHLPVGVGPPVGPLLSQLARAGYSQRVLLSFVNISPRFVAEFSEVARVARAEALFPVPGVESRQWLGGLLSEDSRYWSVFCPHSPVDFNYTPSPIYPTRLSLDFALERLAQADEPTVVWVHLFAPHHPFHLEGRWVAGPDDLASRYHRAISQWDEEMGRFLQQLDARFPNTVVVLSADHGESFGRGEGGWNGTLHGANWLNRDICHIPLIIKTPGQTQGRRLKTFASQIDVAPTLLDLLKIDLPPDLDGESMLPYFDHPDQLSQTVKICVPESYFLRNAVKVEDNPPAWVTGSEDMFAAYLGEFKVGWFQLYERGTDGFLNHYKDALIYGLYKPRSDPDLSQDISKDPANHEVLVRVFNSPLVARYRR
ncbi:MAG: sulfatase-like hydrolase/transferase [Candidatus Eremiobacteraeota bacterium]|nr:sulfatase-like hydrolase/transferase [Candidatus Eremiobacteraeota bacterium]